MEKTKCLYDKLPYETEFDANVLAVKALKEAQDRYEVILDQTLFFPEQGGQTPDQGWLSVGHGLRPAIRCKVQDVQIRDGVIVHVIEQKLEPGDQVHGQIDWDYRFSNMQQHTGEHIFSGIVHSTFGYENVGFHLSDSVVTMDFDGVLSPEDVTAIETRVNQVIADDLVLEIAFPTPQMLESMEYRSKKELEGQVRIVTIPGVDVCACCAPHVRRTGEVGGLKVMHVQNYKGGVRISILCGFRALDAFRQKTKTVDEMMGLLSSSEEELRSHIKRLQTENQNLAYALRQAQEKILAQEAQGLDADAEDVVLFADACDSKAMRSIVNDMVKDHAGYCAIFAGGDEQGYQFIVGSRTKDCRQEAAHLRETFDARGGGGTQMIQGSVRAAKVHLAENWMA